MNFQTRLCLRKWRSLESVFNLQRWDAVLGLAFVESANLGQQVLQLSPAKNLVEESGPIFPNSLPVEIVEVRLVPPPCRVNGADADELRRFRAQPNLACQGQADSWELRRLQYDDEILTPEHDDDGLMEKLLVEFKNEKHREYEERKSELKDLLTLLDYPVPLLITKWPYYRNLAGVQDRGAARFLVKQEQSRLEVSFPRGCLEWTLDQARREAEFRNTYLWEKWSRNVGVPLEKIADQRKQFLKYIGFYERPIPDYLRPQIQPPTRWVGGLRAEHLLDWPIPASVHYYVSFATGRQIWLQEYSSRPQPTRERAEITSAKTQSIDTKSVIVFAGAHYNVTFRGNSFSVPDRAGMRYIVAFIRHAGQNKQAHYILADAWGAMPEPSPLQEYGENESGHRSPRSGDQLNATKQVQKLRQMRNRRAQLERMAEEERTPAEVVELEELREQMGDEKVFNNSFLEQIRVATGKKIPVLDDDMKARVAMQRAINRTLEGLNSSRAMSSGAAAARAAFVEHIRERLMNSFLTDCSYQKTPGVEWVLQC
jgi:hypothetical protein